ncbi:MULTISPECIES: DUF302 domain-containing protein [unclassified Vibrio]|uniref:DUF302 domain-containing protein n=1 Tax=Vibrio sp. HB236076 TaxID=3232307 RepID=A0AB39HJU6_9VIBR|nr:DUF302 domain-containing protein [Vibrio sp. HB161653]MDP5252790.1 DUF302 domain-containing protein [Vibrio sp. HB161653]
MKIIHWLAITGLAVVTSFNATAHENGLVSVKSHYDVNTTVQKLESVLTSKGMTIFAKVDHAAGAKGVNIDLRPTQVVIFGNPKVGSPLMVCQQSMAIDLPQKALISENEQGEVWLTYNDPKYLAKRHHIEGCDDTLNKVSQALANFAKAATH